MRHLPDVHESTFAKVLSCVYFAYESGVLTDDEYSSIMSTLARGIPQSTSCAGMAFHRNPGHVCDPEE